MDREMCPVHTYVYSYECRPCRDKDETLFGIKDSGKRQEFYTGSVRDTETGKGRPDLIPTLAMARLARWFELGALKYGDSNWQRGQPLSRYYASARRHMDKALDGAEDEDHEAAWMWNALAFMWTRTMIEMGVLPPELDDRPRYNGKLFSAVLEAKMREVMKDPTSLDELREELNTTESPKVVDGPGAEDIYWKHLAAPTTRVFAKSYNFDLRSAAAQQAAERDSQVI